MKIPGLIILLLIIVGGISAQSLKPENPYPLKAGINQATADSLVGTQYWYLYATPGSNRLTVRYKQATTLYGADLTSTLTITLYDEKRTWRTTKVVTRKPNASEVTFTADKVLKKMKIIIAVTPPNQNLLRMGGAYEIEATGNVEFGNTANSADPIVRTYDSMVNAYGATRFLANGSVVASDGSTGTWKAFDPENRIYIVEIGKFRWSVQYAPGYGLVKPSAPDMIVFQELRR